MRFPQLIVDPPLRSFFTTLESTYFKSTTTTIIFWVQLGLSMLAAITFGYFFLDESEGHIAIMLLEVVVGLPFLLITAIILAIPMWLVIWLGIKVFGAFLSVGGLLAYACTYGAGVKLFVEKILDIHFHRAAEKLAHGASIRIFRG